MSLNHNRHVAWIKLNTRIRSNGLWPLYWIPIWLTSPVLSWWAATGTITSRENLRVVSCISFCSSLNSDWLKQYKNTNHRSIILWCNIIDLSQVSYFTVYSIVFYIESYLKRYKPNENPFAMLEEKRGEILWRRFFEREIC